MLANISIRYLANVVLAAAAHFIIFTFWDLQVKHVTSCKCNRPCVIWDGTTTLQRLSVLRCFVLTEVFDSDTDIVSSVQCLFNSHYSLVSTSLFYTNEI